MPAGALACPAPSDHGAAFDALFARVQAAESAREVRVAFNEMWALWADAPDAHAQELLDEGMTRRAAHDFDAAAAAFDVLTAYCPDYAEGHNQRAFVNFIRQDHTAALPDLERGAPRAPEERHFPCPPQPLEKRGVWRAWRNGRRMALKMPGPKGRAGSSPAARTISHFWVEKSANTLKGKVVLAVR